MQETIFKLDENDNIRVWAMELDGDKYRTISGTMGGKMVESGWITAKGKNIGKKNETSPEKQAELTVQRKYVEQLSTGYYTSMEAARANKQTVFEPMLAQDYKKLKTPLVFPVFSQPKLDGLRDYVNSRGQFSRNHKSWVAVPHIYEQLKPLFEIMPQCVFDGELYNHDMKNEFEKIVSLTRKQLPEEEDFRESERLIEFHIFDMFDFAAPNVLFEDRFELISTLLKDKPFIKIVQTDKIENQFDLDVKFAEYLEMGYEGQMVRTNSPYEQKRSKTLIKRKTMDQGEFNIKYVESGIGNWEGFCKRVYIELEDGTIQKSGVAGNQPYLKKVLEEAEEYVDGEATIDYQGRSADGLLRFPVAKMLWKNERDI